MNNDTVENLFRRRTPGIANIHGVKQYVLGIPFLDADSEQRILFEVRGAISQPGDVCLPGGGMEEGEDPETALRREIREELLLSDEQIEIVGPSDILISDWGRAIRPYVVKLSGYRGTYSENEVAEVFDLPLSYFLEHEPEVYSVRVEEIPDDDFPFDRISGGRDYNWHAGRREVYFYDYEKYTIWGLTAKIMKRFSEIIRNGDGVKYDRSGSKT